LVILGLACTAGCSGRGSFLTGGPTTGQLKASLAHMEVENQQLRKQVAQLRTDSRAIEDRLVREELNNGDLTARLDNARNLLRDRGVEFDEKPRTASNSRRSMFDDDDDEDYASSGAGAGSRRTLPTGQPSKRTRKPPFARIPGRIERDLDEEDLDEDAVSSRRPTWSPSGQRTSKTNSKHRSGDLLIDDQTMREEQLRWTSIGELNSNGQGGTTRR
jgi:hypothetical protein